MTNKEIYELIMDQKSRRDAMERLTELKLKKTEVISLCKENFVHIRPSDRKEEMMSKFIDSTLGTLLIRKAINNSL